MNSETARYRTNWLRVLLALLVPPFVTFPSLMAAWLIPNGGSGDIPEMSSYAILGALMVTSFAWMFSLLWIPFHFLHRRHWAYALLVGVVPHLLIFVGTMLFHSRRES